MPLTIPATDHGQIRIFAVTPPVPPGLLDADPQAIAQALGTNRLNRDFVDVVDTRTLAGMSLLDYLRQGYDIPADAADDAALRDLTGPVILVMSRASGGEEVTLTPAAGIRHITTVGDPARLRAPAGPLPSAAATGTVAPARPPASDRAVSGRVATIALVVLLALVVVMILIAG